MKKRTEDTKKYYPLTHAQKRIYYDDKFHPGTSAGTQAFIVRYKRILNISLLQQAINKVIRKNVGFRLRIVEIEHEPKQYVEEYRERNFDYVDFSGTDSEHRMREWVDETVRKPIEILEGDPFYFAILKYNEKESGYYMGFHHAVSDGGSYPIVFSEINEIYHELEVGRSVDDELYPSYLEYISDEQEYLGSAQVEKDKKFWHGTLTPLPQPLNITPKKGDPSDTAGAMYVAAFPDHVRTMMFDYGKAHRASLFKLLLAAISIYAAKISRLDDVTIGAVNHNRAEGNREKVVGMFVSTFPIRQKVDGKMTFNQFLETSGKGVNHILKNHQKYPFDRLATELRDTMGADISYLLDIFISAHGDVEKEGYTFEHIFQGYVPNSLNIHINYNNKNLDGKLEMEYEYRAGHYSEEDAARFHRGLVNVLRNALANPKKEISGIDIVSAEEKKQVLDTFNETESGYPEDKTIHQLFEEQVKKTPASTALIYRENKLTYKVLNEKANQLARLLKKEGVKRYSIVAVMMERSMEMIAVIMAVLKSGGDCLPVDPDLSGDHINYLLEDSKSKLLLTREKDAGKVTVNVKVLPLKDESFSQEETDNLGESDEGVNDPALITYASLLSKESKKSEESQTFKYSKGFKHKLGSLTRSLSVLHNRYSPNSSGTWLLKSLSQHSVSVTEMFLWLFNGGRLVILEKGKETDPERLLEVINNLEITHVHFFPTLFNRFINHLNDQNKTIPSTLKHVFLSGEPLYPVLREKFKALKTEARSIENVYCSKENPVFVSVDSLKDEKDKVDMPKEKPQGNVKVYIINVIDEKAVLLPIGAPGEFCVSGDGLGTYLGEDKTDEFIEFHDAKLYRTGDKARWRPDGSIDFLSDHKNNLINRKGVRIDTAEITECLLRQEEIMETVVVARRRKQEISLTAYFESVKKNIEEKVKKKLSGELPKNMMPDFFVQLEQIPLTPNGSVDHEELLAIPAIDRLLAKIEAEVLHLNEENINLDDNFFKAGGNSFKASQVAAKIHKAFNVKVSMAEIFKRPTLRQLAEYLTESIEVKYLSIQPAEPKEYYPMSSVQKRLYFLHHMEVDEDKTAYNIQMMDIYCKGFDKDKLENAFKALIKRHESLRTSFHIVDGEPVQKIHDYEEVGSNFAIEYYETDENGMIFSKQKGKEWTRVTGLPFQDVVEHFVHPFDLDRPPLLRVGFIKILHNTKILMLDMHHIVADGISLEILAKELWELYDDKELPPLRLQYKDFSEWLNSDDQVAAIKEQENFWLGEFEGEIPLINLPTDYPRPAKLTFDGDTVQFGIDALETEQLNKIAADHGESLYMVLFASFNVLLARVTGQEDIVVGTVTAGRGHTDLEQIVGMFLNTLALRSYPEGEKSFETFLSEVKLTAFHAFEHQDYPFDDLVRKVAPRVDASRNPLFDVVFGLENEADPTGYLMEVAIPDKATPYDFGTKKAKFDMTLICIENEAGIEGSIEYKTKLFNRDTIRRFTGYFKKIISYICSDVTQKISQIDMLPRDERKIILNKFNDMTADYPSDKTIHEIFEEHVEKNPENPALMMKEQEFTYSELNERCNRLAAVLRDNRVCPNTIVALMTGRTMELIIAQLGILKAGGAYLSIDIELPDARKKFLLDDSNAGILLVRSEYLEENKAELRALFGKQIIAIDDESIYAGVTDVSNQPTASGPDDLAYVIYTSGTTGKPKGVMMHHRGIASLNVCTRERFQLDETSRVLQFATVSFDASVWEVWMALMNGAALVLVDTDTIQNYERFIDYINSKGITITLLPPIYVNHIDPGSVKTFKTLLTGGAAAGSEMVEKWRRHVQYVNCYGPTEASICCTMWKASKSGAPVTNPPIGVPVDNTNIHIVDKHMNLVPIGVSGELCVSGIHVAKGYLNRPELTDEKFIDDPILEGNRMYRTGDLVRWLPDGTIEYSGRIDFQVKIRGFRIEPGEIENCIARHDSIKDAAVLALDNKITKEKFLCAYFVPHESMDLDVLKDYLHEELPEYMVPSYFVQVDTIPLTPSGKVDKKQLPEPEIGGSAEGYEAPRNGIERQTADVWVLVLGVERVGIEDDFFELGGDSIKAIQIISRLQKGGLILEVSQLFLHKTIKQLGRHIKPIDAVTVKKADQRIVTGNVRLTPIEEWFFKEQDEHARDHFNQYMMFISKPKEGGYDKNHIGEVFKKIMEHHDALRMIYKINGDKVIQENKGVPANEVYDWVTVELENIANDTRLKEEKVFYSHDLKDEELEAEHIDAIAARVHQSFDLEKGPLLKLCLFKGMRVDYLLIVVHHVVVDGISWRILMDDFETGYNQAVKREEIRFSDKTHSFQYWAEELSRYAASSSLLKELPYWNAVENTPAESLPVDCQIERRTFGDYPHTVRELSQDKAEAKEYTRKLKEDVRRAYQTEINDILLAAVGLAVRVWAWKDKENRVDISDVLVNLEGHGREKVVDVDITRTVGWFSTQYPVILDMALSEDRGLSTGILDDIWNAMDDVSDKGHSFQDFVLKMTPEVKKNFDRYVSYAVRKVKETLRRIPNKGIGYGILKYLTTPEKKENIRFKHAPEIVFNYLGEFGGFDYDYIDRIKGLTDMDFKMSWSNDLKFGHKLDIESIIADGELKLYMFYNEKEYVLGKEKNYRGEPDRIKDLAHLIKAILLAVIDHCAEKTVTRLTPYDLGCSKISITGLDRITGDIQARISEDMEIESIYPLTAFQEEMFRATSANKEAYFVQNMFSIPEDADTGLLEESFNIIIDRFQVMRTVFVDAGHDVFITGTSPEPLQIVLKKRTLQIEIKDIAHLSGDEQQKELERIKAADKEAGFDLTTQLPLKVTLVKTGGAFDRLLWSQNHITIDGWCLGVIISDLLDAYDALKANTSPAFEPVYPYRDYIDWLEQADMAEGLEYHREYLAGYKQGVTLASLGNTVESGRFKLEDYYLTLDETVTEGLNRTASKTRVTLNTLFQVLWGVLLQRYTHADDVLFGAIVSGRSAELEGIDTIAGLFINIIPVRIRSGETTTFSALVTERQEQSARSKKHEYFPLPEALGQAGSSATGGPVIDNLMFFENYPLDEENRDMFSGRKDSGLKIEWIENREQIDYSFNFYVIPVKSTTVRFSYNSLVYSDEFIRKSASDVESIVMQVIDNPEIDLKDIKIGK